MTPTSATPSAAAAPSPPPLRWLPWLPWLVGCALTRLWALADEPAYLHPDALGQALEPAFVAAFGHGDVAWEMREGLRSWLWPGLFVPVFALAEALGAPVEGVGMAPFIAAARVLVVAVDLAAAALALKLAWRLGGRVAGVVVAAVALAHPALVIMASQPLIDVPAAALLLWAVSLATAPAGQGDADHRGAALGFSALGVALATTALLRVQLAPAVAALALLWWWRERPALRTLWRVAAAALGAALALGMLDLWTWGAPFHATVAYLRFNLGAGQTAFGVMPAGRYAAHFAVAMPAAALWMPALAALALLRGPQARTIALCCAAIIASHQFVPYKVWRFLHPALWLLLVLAGVGAQEAYERAVAWLAAQRARGVGVGANVAAGVVGVALIVGACAGVAVAWRQERLWRTTWLWEMGGSDAVARARGLDEAALAISAGPAVRHVVQAVVPEAAAPGHALLGHDAEVDHPIGRRLPAARLLAADVWIVHGDDAAAAPAAMRPWWRSTRGDVVVLRRLDAHAPSK